MEEHKMIFMEINTRDIKVDPKGQRDVEKRKAQFNKIMKTFDWRVVQPISVGRVNGEYWCYDGQMTMKVLKARNNNRDLQVTCRMVEVDSMKELADLFILQRGTTCPLKLIDELESRNSYEDEQVTPLYRVAEKNGFRISSSQGKYNINAVRALWDEYKAFGNLLMYDQLLRIMARSWNGDTAGSKSGIIKGLGLFLRTYQGRYKEEQLVKKLASVSPMEIIRNADVDRTSGARKYAVQILNLYNKGNGAKLPMEL